MRRPTLDEAVTRYRLAGRLSRAVDSLDEQPPTPTYVVDLDAFDLNASDLVARAGGKPVRLATKSVRVPELIGRALAVPGFAGVLAYSLREALWIAQTGLCDDVLMGYPSVDRLALGELAADEALARQVILMVDSVEHLDLVDEVRPPAGPPLRVAVDIDAGLRMAGSHVGPRRSPLFATEAVAAMVDEVLTRPGFALAGVMTYEGQVAGVPDVVPGQGARSAAVRGMKQASLSQLRERRAAISAALRERCAIPLWNAGGTGSIESSAADPVITEVTAGSGLLVPHLFDHYESFSARPAAYFGLRVVRRPGPGTVTLAGGGLIASGAVAADRAPLPWAPPGLRLTALEGAGEVQTPLRGPSADLLAVGDLVWFRHAKAGELAEHTATAHLLEGEHITAGVPTYRGAGHTW